MYRFVNGFYKTLTNRVDWIEDPIGINSVPLSLLYTKYYQVRFVLNAPSFTELQFLTINELPEKARTYQGTILDFLQDNGNNHLPTINYVKEKEPGIVKYLNYHTQDFKALAVNIKVHIDANINRDQKVDVLLYKDGLYRSDYDDIVDKSITICNGLLHKAIASDNGIYVLGAGGTTCRTHVNSFGILDFSDIGKVTILPIKNENIVKYMPGLDLADAIYLKIPEEYAGKAVMVSIAGYLYYLGNVMSRVSETIFKIDTDKANIIKRLYESSKYGFDISSVGLSCINGHPDIFLQETEQDAFYYALLTHIQSFFIIADVNDYHVEKILLENPKLPGKYLISRLPKYPLISEIGLLPNYNYRYIDGKFILHTDLLLRNNYIYTTTPWKQAKRLSFHIDPYNPRYYQQAHELRLKFATE